VLVLGLVCSASGEALVVLAAVAATRWRKDGRCHDARCASGDEFDKKKALSGEKKTQKRLTGFG
jgi:hypothetical protein